MILPKTRIYSIGFSTGLRSKSVKLRAKRIYWLYQVIHTIVTIKSNCINALDSVPVHSKAIIIVL